MATQIHRAWLSQIRGGNIKRVGLHYTRPSTGNPRRGPNNAEGSIHFLEICEGWAKLGGVTRTRHIRKQDEEKVRLMTARYKTLKKLIQQLSDLNWEILTLQSE
jgi:hypothetical protein